MNLLQGIDPKRKSEVQQLSLRRQIAVHAVKLLLTAKWQVSSLLLTCMHDLPDWKRYFATHEEYMRAGVTAYTNLTMQLFSKHHVRLEPEVPLHFSFSILSS